MKKTLTKVWTEDDGVLTFEWVMLVTLLTIGIVSGLAGARDAIVDELGDAAQAMMALDQSYAVDYPLGVSVHNAGVYSSSASNAGFTDFANYIDCERTLGVPGQIAAVDDDS
jgi:Flp pilus assembly pilin Flp